MSFLTLRGYVLPEQYPEVGGPLHGAGYPGRDFKFGEIPALPITDEMVTAFYHRDRADYPPSTSEPTTP